jgi:hypothetical protein
VEGCLIVRRSNPIPQHPLLACEPFGGRMRAETVAAALVAGLLDSGRPDPDVCLLPAEPESADQAPALLARLAFDVRMRAARAVVLAVPRLRESTLAGSLAFEMATRARQAGVPCYGVTARNELDSFDARVLDLQLVLQAGTRGSLLAAGRRLGELM